MSLWSLQLPITMNNLFPGDYVCSAVVTPPKNIQMISGRIIFVLFLPGSALRLETGLILQEQTTSTSPFPDVQLYFLQAAFLYIKALLTGKRLFASFCCRWKGGQLSQFRHPEFNKASFLKQLHITHIACLARGGGSCKQGFINPQLPPCVLCPTPPPVGDSKQLGKLSLSTNPLGKILRFGKLVGGEGEHWWVVHVVLVEGPGRRVKWGRFVQLAYSPD